MRRTLIGLVAAVALVAAACGGDDSDVATDDEVPEAGDEGSPGVDEGSPGELAGSDFCQELFDVDGEDEEDVIDELRSLDPPPEAAGDLESLIDNAEVLSQVDEDDPEALEEVQDELIGAQQAFLNLQQQCGF